VGLVRAMTLAECKIRPIVIGTAGHIDHGKSSLVQALTGIDPDRLKEEKERGPDDRPRLRAAALPDGRTVGIIDVPGHERFVRNMVAGATGIDLVVLVVAADDGVMPQTREHLDIMGLLGRQSAASSRSTRSTWSSPAWPTSRKRTCARR
jgi:selenocysteine-specific elongation factor